MLLAERHSRTAARYGGESRPAHLRFRADGRLVELRPGKTTIGSSPRCDLRIERAGIAPVHCLIVRNEDRLSIRRWAIDTRLNGEPFDEATLEVGDFLKLGEVELELVGSSPTNETTDRIESSLRLADSAAIACSEWLASESVPAGGSPGGDDWTTREATAEPLAEQAPALTGVDFAASPLGDSPGEVDAAEFVFRELQTACRIARGRSRRLLASLREARKHNDELTRQLKFARDELAELSRERLDRSPSVSERPNWQSEWEAEIRALRCEIAELEGRLTDHACSMSALQSQLTSVAAIEPHVGDRRRIGLDLEGDSATSPASQLDVTSEETEANNEGQCLSTPLVDEGSGWNGVLDGTEGEAAAFDSANGQWGPAASQVTQAENRLESEDDSQQLEVEVPAWVGRGVATEVGYAESDASPFDDPEIWKPAATRTSDGFEEMPISASNADGGQRGGWQSQSAFDATDAEVRESPLESSKLWQLPEVKAVGPVAPEENPTPAQHPATSYIERFAHMFADEPADVTLADAPLSNVASDSRESKPRSLGIIRDAGAASTPTDSGEEESIEQYMAKLLQRVRGDSPAAVVPATAPRVDDVEDQPVGSCPESSNTLDVAPATLADSTQSGSADEDVEIPVNWDAFARRATAPATDLGPLRALANETARRAISRHALKKHRRDAVTKVIVSALAGMTSLWLMLDAPNWHDIQFIAACVSLLVAAYWAGEAGRAMIESFRAAAYEGRSAGMGEMETHEEPALPIDFEDRV